MPVEILQIDAFADAPFRGNPAAVCLLDDDRPAEWMQAVAAEMNLSETAFVRAEGEEFPLRWFTPTVEVALCGHATLASAHALWETGRLDGGAPARFRTRSGGLAARRRGELVELDLPAIACEPAEPPAEIVEAVGVAPRAVRRTVGRGDLDWLLELESERVVRSLAPDLARLRAAGAGVIVTARAEGGKRDFVSRYFAGAYGIDEDPVTGAAHCVLVPYWRDRLGRERLTGYQASARGGTVRGELRGDRVALAGRAVTVLRGRLEV